MIKTESNTKGYSLLEVILVVLLVAISLGFSLLYYQSSQVRSDVNSQTAELVEYLRLTQSNAVAGLDDSAHGVHLETSSYALFTGDTYNPDDPNNLTIDLPVTLAVQNINLNGGGNDIIFSPPNGETSTYGIIEIHSSQINKTKTITITALGTVNY